MKLLSTATTLLVCFAPLTVSGRSIALFGSSQAPIQVDSALSVPGDNPLDYCNDPSDYLVQIESVDLAPNPPLPYELTFDLIRDLVTDGWQWQNPYHQSQGHFPGED